MGASKLGSGGYGAPRRSRKRWQGTNPITGARMSLEAKTAGDLAELVARARRIGHELRAGTLTEEQAHAQIAMLKSGRIALPRLVRLRDIWPGYLATLTHPPTKAKAVSTWKILEPELGAELVAEIHDGRLDRAFATWTAKGYSSSYVTKTIWAFLAAAVTHAKRAKIIARLPWDEPRPPKVITKRRPSAATELEELAAIVAAAKVEDLLEEARGRLGDLARRVLVLCLCNLRSGEGAGLGWDHVDFARGLISIEFQALDQWRTHYPDKTRPDFKTKNAKKKGPLVMRLHPDALEALTEQKRALEARGWYREDGPVFPTKNGAWRLNANCIYPEDARRIAVAAGIPHAARFVTHSFRHTGASLEMGAGANPLATIKRTGHSTIRQLEQYGHTRDLPASAIPRLPAIVERAAAEESAEGKTEDANAPP